MKSELGIFPTEESLKQLRSKNILNIIDGLYNDKYYAWVIKGPFNGLHKPLVVFAVFPTGTGRLDLEHAEAPNITDIPGYLHKLKRLNTSPGLEYVEDLRYEGLVIFGDLFLQSFGENVLAGVNMPSSMVIFNGPDWVESACLLCPTIIPPSVALRQIKTQANYQIGRNGY